MLNPIENRMMKDFLPHLDVAQGTRELNRSQSLQDYTSKDSGGEAYSRPEDKGFKPDPSKQYFDILKNNYSSTTELQLRLTERVRMQLREFGPELVVIMIDYWNRI